MLLPTEEDAGEGCEASLSSDRRFPVCPYPCASSVRMSEEKLFRDISLPCEGDSDRGSGGKPMGDECIASALLGCDVG